MVKGGGGGGGATATTTSQIVYDTYDFNHLIYTMYYSE